MTALREMAASLSPSGERKAASLASAIVAAAASLWRNEEASNQRNNGFDDEGEEKRPKSLKENRPAMKRPRRNANGVRQKPTR